MCSVDHVGGRFEVVELAEVQAQRGELLVDVQAQLGQPGGLGQIGRASRRERVTSRV
ncbi:hypothetical protein PUR71_13375 [Streptomyces sp. SP17BM10]|uniref:hypothetical protein n=1 Tax=Streptomyces sp. SP17BM10 TaxID=3002530 RepID=UPI002E79241E|nr:hypothetical protein [Streptomyces sp. SP17BM10]MEE1783892.1 hypothetical protein [Streptomyces sp. SP17BM10]